MSAIAGPRGESKDRGPSGEVRPDASHRAVGPDSQHYKRSSDQPILFKRVRPIP
jgi:hypothetical protein